MSWVAIWLVGVGLADLLTSGVGSSTDPVGGRTRLGGSMLVGAAAVVLLLLVGDLAHGWNLVFGLVAAISAGLWPVTVRLTEVPGRRYAIPLAHFIGTLVLLFGCSALAAPVAGPLSTWLSGIQLPLLDNHGPTHALLVAGLMLVQLSTGNILVRLVLRSIGALPPARSAAAALPTSPGNLLRGGRLLGPLERIFILGLGLAGQVTAASLVIAAKGLIRWPELQSQRAAARQLSGGTEPASIDEVTEYFLVGSFVSWLVALASLALAHG